MTRFWEAADFFLEDAGGPKLSTCDPVTSPRPFSKPFFDLTSDAFHSKTSRPDSLPIKVALVVLPIPGGPERSAAFLGPLGAPNDFGALGPLKIPSHLSSPKFEEKLGKNTC